MRIDKKTHNKYSNKISQPNHLLRFGRFGIKTTNFGRITRNQINSIERDLICKLRVLTNSKNTKFWNCIILNLNLTKLSLESRMGKGKGNIYTKAIFLKPGTVIFEFDKISFQHIQEVFEFIKKKMPAKITLLSRQL
uniref:Ribosomal protein L16 n=1 Tax=Rhodymenia pseudopalmata TaxID=31502 RepID=V9NFF1_RHOPU|nr:ribosomal protein L16 [Rhodymenia pseudopalmata]AGO19259.1 ribosomal protein L16 [Rhodymenia pseudopalmata]